MKTLNILFTVLVLLISGCTQCSSDSESEDPKTAVEETNDDSPPISNNTSELQIDDIVIGEGAVAEAGKKVTVHYTGTLTDGKKFDSSKDRDRPFTFDLGAGKVIKGWDEGVVGMKVGGQRKLIIPSSMGYKERGVPGVIPPNSVLVFEVELLSVE